MAKEAKELTPNELNSILVGHTFEMQGSRSHADCTVKFLGLNISVGKVGVETIPGSKRLVVRPRYLTAPTDSPEDIKDALNSVSRLCNQEDQGEIESEQPAPASGSLVPKSLFGSSASPEWASAATRGCLEIVEAALERGQKIEAKCKFGRTALWLASDGGHVSVVARLLEAGAQTDIPSHDENDAPLHRAAYRGHPAIVRLLLAAGAAPYQRNVNGRTPLDLTHVIDGRGQAEARAILEESAGTGADFVQDTPQTSSMFSNLEIVEAREQSPALARARASKEKKYAGDGGSLAEPVATEDFHLGV